jgi:trehalose-6-phosphatase
VGKGGVPVTLHHSMLKVPSTIRDALKEISEVCELVIISPHSDLLLSRFLGDLNAATVTESGGSVRFPWQDGRTIKIGELSGKERIKNLMKYFMTRTPGSYMEETDSTLKLFFDNTPTDFGPAQMRELLVHLYAGPLANSEADLVACSRYVEVRPRGVSVGSTLKSIFSGRPAFDGCVVITAMTQKDEAIYQDVADLCVTGDVVTVSVGQKETNAKFFIPSVADVQKLILQLGSCIRSDQ